MIACLKDFIDDGLFMFIDLIGLFPSFGEKQLSRRFGSKQLQPFSSELPTYITLKTNYLLLCTNYD